MTAPERFEDDYLSKHPLVCGEEIIQDELFCQGELQPIDPYISGSNHRKFRCPDCDCVKIMAIGRVFTNPVITDIEIETEDLDDHEYLMSV